MKTKKTFPLFFFIALAVVPLGLLVIDVVQKRAEKRSRAELHMLDYIEAGIERHIYTGGQLPTDWGTFTNWDRWRTVQEICEINQLPAPAESYTFLRQPVGYRDFDRTGSVFLVRSEPLKRSGSDLGRWGLLFGGTSGSYYVSAISNQIFRIWIKESELPAKIRSQLANQPAN